MFFDRSAKIKGASISTYLLEKSRVSHTQASERNYHVFYNMLRGMAPERLAEFHLTYPRSASKPWTPYLPRAALLRAALPRACMRCRTHALPHARTAGPPLASIRSATVLHPP